MIKTYLRNDFVIFPICLCFVLTVFQVNYAVDEIPSFTKWWLMIWGSFLVEDFYHYWTHRIIHIPKLYWIHKKHHSQYNTIHISCVHSHWMEMVFGVAFSLLAGTMILQEYIHITNVSGIMLLRLIQTHENHSGYELSFSVFQIMPFMVDSNYHNHHHLKNIGNFSNYFIFWDYLFGTNKCYMKKFDKTKQIEQ